MLRRPKLIDFHVIAIVSRRTRYRIRKQKQCIFVRAGSYQIELETSGIGGRFRSGERMETICEKKLNSFYTLH